MPLTAHFLGGCPIGDSPETGMIDPYHRLYGHPGISVVDGAGAAGHRRKKLRSVSVRLLKGA